MVSSVVLWTCVGHCSVMYLHILLCMFAGWVSVWGTREQKLSKQEKRFVFSVFLYVQTFKLPCRTLYTLQVIDASFFSSSKKTEWLAVLVTGINKNVHTYGLVHMQYIYCVMWIVGHNMVHEHFSHFFLGSSLSVVKRGDSVTSLRAVSVLFNFLLNSAWSNTLAGFNVFAFSEHMYFTCKHVFQREP